MEPTYLTLAQFIKARFPPGSKPTRRKVVNWIRRGLLKGKIMENDVYVDLKDWDDGPLEPDITDSYTEDQDIYKLLEGLTKG